MKIIPLYDRILVERNTEENKTNSGLIIIDSTKEKPIQGTVISAGEGKIDSDQKLRPLSVKEGDKVLFGKYAGTEIKLDGKEYLMMREEDVLAKLQDA